MKDSLQAITKTEIPIKEAVDFINGVNDFYNSAWDKLIIVGTVVFGIVGIAVPLMIQWYQKKLLLNSETLLKKDIESQTQKIKAELLVEVNRQADERMKKFEQKMDELNAAATARSFHLQANSMIKDKMFSEALADYIVAGQHYIVCTDFTNLHRVLSGISDSCFPHISQEEISDVKIQHEADLDAFLNKLSGIDENGAFSTSIRDIRYKVTKLPKSKNKSITNTN